VTLRSFPLGAKLANYHFIIVPKCYRFGQDEGTQTNCRKEVRKTTFYSSFL
jgi:hypothetical protein